MNYNKEHVNMGKKCLAEAKSHEVEVQDDIGS
jgi:hypothetical protein